MVTFYIANTLEEVENATYTLNFDEDIQEKINENIENYHEDIKLFATLDPYDDEILGLETIKKIKEVLEKTIPKCIDEDILNFILDFLKLCNQALEDNKNIYALGD